MENFEIQNHLGEVLTIVNQEQLTKLIEENEFAYFEHDSNPEYDLVTYFENIKETEPLNVDSLPNMRIYKQIVEISE